VSFGECLVADHPDSVDAVRLVVHFEHKQDGVAAHVVRYFARDSVDAFYRPGGLAIGLHLGIGAVIESRGHDVLALGDLVQFVYRVDALLPDDFTPDFFFKIVDVCGFHFVD
jgi:hypothetical protein